MHPRSAEAQAAAADGHIGAKQQQDSDPSSIASHPWPASTTSTITAVREEQQHGAPGAAQAEEKGLAARPKRTRRSKSEVLQGENMRRHT
eukprot:1140025-Pelagomonas_calceolata.AAC.5